MGKRIKFEQIHKDAQSSFRYIWSVQHYSGVIQLHFHPEIEIAYIHCGAGYRMMGDYLEAFSEGEVLFIPANVPHCWLYDPDRCHPNGDTECLVAQFLPSLLQQGMSFFSEWALMARQLLSLQQGMRVSGKEADEIKILLQQMAGQTAPAKLLSLIQIISLCCAQQALSPIGPQIQGANGITRQMKRTQIVFKYMMENYSQKISLQAVAQTVQMSETAFCAYFRRETGKTWTDYLNAYRIDMACALLKNHPEKKISEIAWQCGFPDVHYFSRYFKRCKGITPGQCKPARPGI
jgi:AraC-like DNA-binding protein